MEPEFTETPPLGSTIADVAVGLYNNSSLHGGSNDDIMLMPFFVVASSFSVPVFIITYNAFLPYFLHAGSAMFLSFLLKTVNVSCHGLLMVVFAFFILVVRNAYAGLSQMILESPFRRSATARPTRIGDTC